MWRKFTVYGLRFSKTSFWNRINTGFLDPAVATVLTACGIETVNLIDPDMVKSLNSCNSAYRLRYWNFHHKITHLNFLKLQQCLPLAVLKHDAVNGFTSSHYMLQQCLPLAVLKRIWIPGHRFWGFAPLQQCLPLAVLKRWYHVNNRRIFIW